MKDVVFKDPIVLANHIMFVLDTDSPVRIQKSLYFLFAMYGYIFKDNDDYPTYPFKEPFEAWKFGPVLRTIYLDGRDNLLIKKEWLPQNDRENTVYDVIDDILFSVNQLGDYELVQRTHQDEVWSNAYIQDENTNEIGIMDSDEIINEYTRNISKSKIE